MGAMSVAGRPVKSDLQLVGLDLGNPEICLQVLHIAIFGFKRFDALKRLKH